MRTLLHNPRVWLVGAAALAVIVLTVAASRALDRAGWLPHRQDTSMYMGSAAWVPGQVRKCAALPAQDGSMIFLGCVEGAEDYQTPQVVDVTYWGRIQRRDMFRAITAAPGERAWQWRCQKQSSSLTCWAVN